MPTISDFFSFIGRLNGGEYSPMGAAHTALSRQKLHEHAQRPDFNKVDGRLDLWAATVSADANRFAWVARQAAKPLTTLTDFALGTARPERSGGGGVVGSIAYGGSVLPALAASAAGGLAGGAVGVVTTPVGFFVTSKWVKNCAMVGAGIGFGAVEVPFLALREAAGAGSLAPKLALTAPAYAVGALYGTVHGLVVVRRNKHRNNDTTMIELASLDTIPQERRFISKDNCVFDIEELVAFIEANQTWSNPFTHKAFSGTDIERIVNHASGMGAKLRPLANANSLGAQGLSVQTIKQLETLARTLATDTDEASGNQKSRQALGTWFAYHASLSAAERSAIDIAPQLVACCFHANLAAVLQGAKCIHEFGSILRRAVEQIQAQVPHQRSGLTRYFTT